MVEMCIKGAGPCFRFFLPQNFVLAVGFCPEFDLSEGFRLNCICEKSKKAKKAENMALSENREKRKKGTKEISFASEE